MWRSGLADDKAFAGGFDDLARDRGEVVDLEDAPDWAKRRLTSRRLPLAIPATVAIASVSVKSWAASSRPSVRQWWVRTKRSSSALRGRY
jgi:hypothetical protein